MMKTTKILPTLVTFLTLLAVASAATATRGRGMKKVNKISIQELQSPAGPRHSDGIVTIPAASPVEDQLGFVYFSNDLVVPGTGGPVSTKPMGTQTGHCIEVSKGIELACYFNFKITSNSNEKGTFLAEALFSLTNFPAADLTITGGTGDFRGIIGSGKTVKPEPFNGTTFVYEFEYDIAKY